MGGKPSIHIQTPNFIQNEWQYLPEGSQTIEQYGIFRTLRHVKSGQKIDQYEFLWANQVQYEYYLKSFNWRYKQPNVVSTKFIVETSKRSMCSINYTARIYIEHMKVRLSQISDIPFPDNLYVLMESLEGYRKIFQHSKYFQIEESQICIDDYGNLKIWVNSDLSINYPANEGFLDFKEKGEEEMVETLISIIAQNTDSDTEPTPSFREYFDDKKGSNGKNFEEAKVIVMSYSRLKNTQIPVRFEAIANLDAEEQQTINKYAGDSINTAHQNGAPTQYKVHANPQPRITTIHFSSNPNAVYHIKNPQFASPVWQRPVPYVPSYQMQPVIYQQFYPVPPNYFPQIAPYQMMQQGYRPVNIPMPINYGQNVINMSNSQRRIKQYLPMEKQNQHPSNKHEQLNRIPEVEAKRANSLNSIYEKNKSQSVHKGDIGELQKQYILQPQQIQQEQEIAYQINEIKPQQEHYSFQSHKLKNSSSSNKDPSSISVSEADDVVARSLPIKADQPQKRHLGVLGVLGHNQKPIYSQVSSNQWPNNNGFGLTYNSGVRQKESDNSKKKPSSNSLISASQARPVKYFYTLDDEEEMDADIAADLARYVS